MTKTKPKSINVRISLALDVFVLGKEVTPEAINAHMGDTYATGHVCRLRKAGHNIVTLRSRRKVIAYKLSAYAPSYNPEDETPPHGSILN